MSPKLLVLYFHHNNFIPVMLYTNWRLVKYGIKAGIAKLLNSGNVSGQN